MINKNVDTKETATTDSTVDLDTLKGIAKILNIEYHPSIGIAKLTEKIETKSKLIDMTDKANTLAEKIKEKQKIPTETKMQQYTRMRADAMKLVRVRVNCMNPNKQKWPGEILTVRNRVIGTVKKFIPYNLETPYHIPDILYKHLLERQCQIFFSVRDKNGKTRKQGKLIKEFSIDVLPPLTPKELDDLVKQQALANNIE